MNPDDRLVVMHDAVAPAGVAEELATMSPEDRAVAQRVADLAEIDPAEGYEERAVERARRDGVLRPT